MSNERQAKKKKGSTSQEVLSWMDKKALADKEEEELVKDVQELSTWTSLIGSMDDQQLKEYVTNRPENMHSAKLPKAAPEKRVRRSRKPEHSSSNGIMATIWKFHKDDGAEPSVQPAKELSVGESKKK